MIFFNNLPRYPWIKTIGVFLEVLLATSVQMYEVEVVEVGQGYGISTKKRYTCALIFLNISLSSCSS